MRGRSSHLRLVVALAASVAVPVVAFVGASCSAPTSSNGSSPMVTLAPTLVAPQGVLDQIKTLNLSIYADPGTEAGPSCNMTTGQATNTTGVTPLYSTSKASMTGCGSGATFCLTDPSLAQSNVARVFAVTGYSDAAQAVPIAYGCTVETVNGGDAETTASFAITMLPIPAVCSGNGTLQPPQTCNEPADGGAPVCVSCQTVEEVLSNGDGVIDGGSLTLTGSPGDKSSPSFAWPVGMGDNFIGVFGDMSSGTPQISLRVLSSTLSPSPAGGVDPIDETYSTYIPNGTMFSPAPSPEPHSQQQPAATQNNGVTYVAFADNTVVSDAGGTGPFAIKLRSFDSLLTGQQAEACPISTTTGAAANGETGSLSSPAIALTGVSGSSALFIAWQDAGGNIYGRLFTPSTSGGCGSLGAQELMSTGNNNSHVSIAGIPSGWIAVWQSGSDIVIRPVNTLGVPSGKPQPIESTGHSGTSPTVAAISAGAQVSSANIGAFAVVWSDQANGTSPAIVAQRYGTGKESGVSLENQTQISVSSNAGGEVTPFIAPSATATGAYVVTWVDGQSPSQVRARYLSATIGALDVGTSAYLTNPVDGTTNDFPVGVASNRTRVTPTAVVGGGGPYYNGAPFVAFGWADNTNTAGVTSGYGIVARRFPAP